MRLDVDDDRPVLRQQHVIRHVLAFPTLDCCAEKEWLSNDPAHSSIEVGEQKSREFRAGLIDDMTLLGR